MLLTVDQLYAMCVVDNTIWIGRVFISRVFVVDWLYLRLHGNCRRQYVCEHGRVRYTCYLCIIITWSLFMHVRWQKRAQHNWSEYDHRFVEPIVSASHFILDRAIKRETIRHPKAENTYHKTHFDSQRIMAFPKLHTQWITYMFYFYTCANILKKYTALPDPRKHDRNPYPYIYVFR